MIQHIYVDKNVLFTTILGDFLNKIAHMVLQEIDEFWVRALWKSTLQHYHVHLYLHLYDSSTGSVAA